MFKTNLRPATHYTSDDGNVSVNIQQQEDGTFAGNLSVTAPPGSTSAQDVADVLSAQLTDLIALLGASAKEAAADVDAAVAAVAQATAARGDAQAQASDAQALAQPTK